MAANLPEHPMCLVRSVQGEVQIAQAVFDRPVDKLVVVARHAKVVAAVLVEVHLPILVGIDEFGEFGLLSQ